MEPNDTNTDPRQQRGLVLAATKKITKKGSLWLVPSASHAGTYVVDDGDQPSCSCPDFETRQCRCKHIWAVEYARHRVIGSDGSQIVTETVKVTYTQDWPAYNRAQQHEEEEVEGLLHALCEGIEEAPQAPRRGRPRLPLSTIVFAAVMKVFSLMSGRRACSTVRECQEKGLVDTTPHYNTVFNYLENPALTPLLKALIEESAAPLKAVETDFAVDSSGFSTSVFARWYDKKYGKEIRQHKWLKVHLMTGVKTNVVTSVEVMEADSPDCPQFSGLVNKTAERFDIEEISADKAYLSHKNLDVVDHMGAVPFIPFKRGTGSKGSEVWSRMFHLYNLHRAEFLAHYGKRSNVETTFSMIKRKFGGSVRSKTYTAQVNELLCKVLCHNLSVLVQSQFQMGLEVNFGEGKAA